MAAMRGHLLRCSTITAGIETYLTDIPAAWWIKWGVYCGDSLRRKIFSAYDAVLSRLASQLEN